MSDPMPASTARFDTQEKQVTELLLEQILAKAHPLLAEGINLAAIPYSFDVALFTALRAADDGRDERMVNRLLKFSFVSQLENVNNWQSERYRLQSNERHVLLQRWLTRDPAGFVAAHGRALAFATANPSDNPFTQARILLYHQLFADYDTGVNTLVAHFRSYANSRQLAAIDQLLTTAAETSEFLAVLNPDGQARLLVLLEFLRARLMQLRGQWAASLAPLARMRQDGGLPPELAPYVIRAYGSALAQTNKHVEAIGEYNTALELFGKDPALADEYAFTMLDLGDVHTNLALAARGYREPPAPDTGWAARIWSLVTLPPLPLTLYLSFFFGWRVWLPRSWAMLGSLDWVIARLFARGARWYQRAGRVFARNGIGSGADRVAESLARLHLSLGNAPAALPLLSRLLAQTERPLGRYRRASIQVALAKALLREGDAANALVALELARPIIVEHEDQTLLAEASGLLAEVRLANNQPEAAVTDFDSAIRLYQRSGDLVGATEIAERLIELNEAEQRMFDARVAESTGTGRIPKKYFPVRFQHPVLETFQTTALLGLVLFLIILPLFAVSVRSGINLTPRLNFFSFPVLLQENLGQTLNYGPSLSEAIAPGLAEVADADLALGAAAALIIFYVLAYPLIGFLVILGTPLRAVQKATAATMVRLNIDRLIVGQGENLRQLLWRDVTGFYVANIYFLGRPVRSYSSIIVQTAEERIVIRGRTAWYPTLAERLRYYIPSQVATTDLSYNILRSKMFVWLLLNLALLLAVGALANLKSMLAYDALLGTVYSPTSLLPYIFLGFAFPFIWWVIIQPLRIRAQARPESRLVPVMAVVGLILAGLHLLTLARPWLTVPDLMPALLLIVMLAGTVLALARVKTPAWRGLRWAAIAACCLALLATALFAGRDMIAYHELLQGDVLTREALAELAVQADGADAAILDQAISKYEHVLAWSNRPGPSFGLPPTNQFIWSRALSHRAALRSLQGNYDEAVDDYSELLEITDRPAEIHANRGVAYASWGAGSDDADEARELYNKALADMEVAVDLVPTNASYYLWKGAILHVLDDLDQAKAAYVTALELDETLLDGWLAAGWLHYQEGAILATAVASLSDETEIEALKTAAATEYDTALADFNRAVELAPQSPAAWLALGYAQYALTDYDAALASWSEAASLAPDNPVMIISRATGRWRVGTAPSCSSASTSNEEAAVSVQLLMRAIDDLNLALELRPTDAFTYRTRGQIEWLLRLCSGFDYEAQSRQAISSYDQAVSLAPAEDFYWNFRGRIKWDLARYLFRQGDEGETQARALLADAAVDLTTAYEMDATVSDNAVWYNFAAEDDSAESLAFFYADRARRADVNAFVDALADFDAAAAIYAGLLTSRYDNTAPGGDNLADYQDLVSSELNTRFDAALAAFAAGEVTNAANRYNEAYNLAQAAGDHGLTAIDGAVADLTAFLEENEDRLSDAAAILALLEAE